MGDRSGVRLRRYECGSCGRELYLVYAESAVVACPFCAEPEIEYDGVADRVVRANSENSKVKQ